MLEDIFQQKILAYQALNKRKFADIFKIVIVIRAKSIFNKFMRTIKGLKAKWIHESSVRMGIIFKTPLYVRLS